VWVRGIANANASERLMFGLAHGSMTSAPSGSHELTGLDLEIGKTREVVGDERVLQLDRVLLLGDVADRPVPVPVRGHALGELAEVDLGHEAHAVFTRCARHLELEEIEHEAVVVPVEGPQRRDVRIGIVQVVHVRGRDTAAELDPERQVLDVRLDLIEPALQLRGVAASRRRARPCARDARAALPT
jgi:hypothetical protein